MFHDRTIKYLKWSIYITVGLFIISAISYLMQYHLLSAFEDGLYTNSEIDSLAITNDKRVQTISIITIISILVSFSLGARWFF